MDRRLFCLNTEANMLEEPGAVVPHAGICAGRGRKGHSYRDSVP